MSIIMAKKRRGPKTKSGYQVHLSCVPMEAESRSSYVDFTEKKLVIMANAQQDPEIKKLFLRILHDYLKGLIAVAWEDGEVPVYVFLEKH